ncbi:MAG: thioredoxin family protein [Okeania sp. SIO2D1]|nr:thioredoxin family protein [Okeania sp. SIO2D1]
MIAQQQTDFNCQYAPDFELPGIDGQVHHLGNYLEEHGKNLQLVGVVFMCNHCPYVNEYIETLRAIQEEFASQGFTLIGINPNDEQQIPEDSFERMKNFAQQKHLNFPYLRDASQDVAKCFQARTTPEAFLIDKQGIVRYTGRIDSNPESSIREQKSYLYQAIAALLSGKEAPVSSTEVSGSPIIWH